MKELRKAKLLKRLEELKKKFVNLTLYENIQDRVEEEDENESETNKNSTQNLQVPNSVTPKYKIGTPKFKLKSS